MKVGDVLKVVGEITSVERKKVNITAKLLGEASYGCTKLDSVGVIRVDCRMGRAIACWKA